MNAALDDQNERWLVSGLRTPFAKVDGALNPKNAIELSVPVVRAMVERTKARPDFLIWGAVAPNLGWSNIAREVLLDSGIDPTIPAFTTIMACSTSMAAALEAAQMLDGRGRDLALAGGVESMSHVQIGLDNKLSDWLRQFQLQRSLGQKISKVMELQLRDVRLHIPSVANRTTGKSMGEHTEEMVKTWSIGRAEQDELALASHQNCVKAWNEGFFDDLVLPLPELAKDLIARADTTLEKLAKLSPAFDRTSGKGTLTAGNSTPLTDGAGGLWVATTKGLERLGDTLPRVKLIDWELGAVDIQTEGLLMAPAYSIPKMLARRGLRYDDIGLWEIHEAFAGQVLCHIKALEDRSFLRDKAGVDQDFGLFPRDRLNPNGGSLAIGHPFGATGARILSQTVKELAARPSGTLAIVSICADGGVGTVALLQSA